jgi:pimeloyl-ACP methyl ester carboxylesterase
VTRLLRTLLVVLAGIALAVVLLPLIVPIPELTGTVPPQELADPDGRYAEVGGIGLYHKAAGIGEPGFLLLHGFPSSLFTWREVLGPLAAQSLTVAYDRPAFGLTERPMPGEWTGESPYSTRRQAGLAVGLMDHVGMERAILVGNSAGGAVAIQVALDNPYRVAALILVSPAVSLGESSGGSHWLPDWLVPLARTPQGRRIGPLLLRNIQAWGRDLAARAWHDPSKISDEVWKGYLLPLRAENWDRALWESLLASEPLDINGRLGELTMPILVITGDDDRVVPTEQSIRLAGGWKGAHLVVLPECGHAPQEECPAAFLQAVLDFAREFAPPSPSPSEVP